MKVHIHTFGCQMNVNDTETMMGLLEIAGHEMVETPEEADLVIINTCAVRQKAEDKFYGKLGELNRIRRRKHLIVGVAGCIAEKDGKKLLERDDVDFVVGTRAISRVTEAVSRAMKGEKVAILDDHLDELNAHVARRRMSSHHAWVTVIYGCDKFCTYCIVPYTRGREKSRPMEDVLEEVRELARKGYREITFLGQNVDSYGKDLGDGASLAKLLMEAEKVDGIERLWFLTSYPVDFDEKLVDVIAASRKIARSIHLPVQSGSDEILKKMNRGYTRGEYMDLIHMIRTRIPDASISTDIIVGFPGETEKDFEDTLDLVRKLRFERINLAMYSPREGTVAAKYYKDDVPRAVKSRRLQTLLELQKRINLEINERYLGKVVRIIGEDRMKDGRYYGRTIRNKIVIFESEENPVGRFLDIKVERVTPGPLYGRIIWMEGSDQRLEHEPAEELRVHT